MRPGNHPDDAALQRVADGETSAADADLVAHVGECAECAGAVERIRRVSAALALSAPVPAAPPLRLRPRRRPALAIAALVAAAIVIAVVLRPGTTPTVDPSIGSTFDPGASDSLDQELAAFDAATVDSVAARAGTAARFTMVLDVSNAASVALADSIETRLRQRGVAADSLRRQAGFVPAGVVRLVARRR